MALTRRSQSEQNNFSERENLRKRLSAPLGQNQQKTKTHPLKISSEGWHVT